VQSVPGEADGEAAGLRAQVDRLAGHPSLAGWFVGHVGRMAGNLRSALREIDPTRCVFDRLPGAM